ncbi:hypothetical protein AB205_0135860 [Aquarana catesbeiana]|uniref:Tumor protein D54 n=1 Tax=Aquarana catesbeiana TaxID=8400 RepID=A0A2G9NNJ7_AQUCT|nr:hypothetical protein AB205_0135860 [Aquarana catesbeiana]
MTDVPVDQTGSRVPADAAGAGLPEGLTEAEVEELQADLAKLKRCGSQALYTQSASISEHHSYVKTSEKLGEWNEKMTQSDVYKKTQETLSTAGQKTSAALSNVGSVISRKLGDMSLL